MLKFGARKENKVADTGRVAPSSDSFYRGRGSEKKRCSASFEHPGHNDDDKKSAEEKEKKLPVAGKVFQCEKEAGHEGQHRAAHEKSDDENPIEVGWE